MLYHVGYYILSDPLPERRTLWVIEVEASSPERACAEALKRNPGLPLEIYWVRPADASGFKVTKLSSGPRRG
jgi:hypothetical protein